MTIWRFDADRVAFRVAHPAEVDADPGGVYVFSRLDGLTIRKGAGERVPFPADGRLVVAGVEFTKKDFPCWERYQKLARGEGMEISETRPRIAAMVAAHSSRNADPA